MNDDILIIGAGVIGMLTARELSLAGARVTVVDRTQPGTEASWAGGGILSPLHPWRYPPPITALARWGQDAYPGLATQLDKDTGIDPEYFRCGLLALDEPDPAAARDWAGATGYTLEALSADQLKADHDYLAPGHQALWLPQLANIRNPRLVQALYRDLQRRGVSFALNHDVRDLLTDGTRVSGVDTDQGPMAAGQVVLCAGAWSRRLGNRVGLDLPVRPVKGQMLLLQGPPGTLPHMVLGPDHYLIPRRDGHILAGSTLEYLGYDKTITEAARELLLSRARALVPALAALPVVKHWAGLRPGTPGGMPIIGPHPRYAGLFVNTGHFRNGVVLAPGSARLLADLLLGRSPDLDPAPFAPA